ncbi:MAG: DUF1127 domain-containing protein [Pseudomonadota bacterium]
MTTTTYGNATAIATPRGALAARLAKLKAEWTKWRLYRRTLDELSSLSDRDLDDLGLSRAMIRGIALEAAYGK